MSAPPKYTDEPPAALPAQKGYGTVPASGASEPLLSASPSGSAPAPYHPGNSSNNNNTWMDQPSEDDLPDDFKVGVAVIDCDAAIRLAFIRKVYTILAIQLACTAAVGLGMNTGPAVDFTRENPWVIWVPMIGSFVSLIGTYIKRHDFPLNMVMLGLFTLFEAVMVGALTSFYESRIVLQAVLITLGVFLGLTLFTFQTRLDFSSLYPFLFAGIWGILAASLVHLFMPFSATMDLVIAGFSVVLFAAFILYDTQQIMKRLSVDEVILGVLSLYLDILNLFLSILRVLNNQNSR